MDTSTASFSGAGSNLRATGDVLWGIQNDSWGWTSFYNHFYAPDLWFHPLKFLFSMCLVLQSEEQDFLPAEEQSHTSHSASLWELLSSSSLCCCSVQPLHQRNSCDQGVITTLGVFSPLMKGAGWYEMPTWNAPPAPGSWISVCFSYHNNLKQSDKNAGTRPRAGMALPWFLPLLSSKGTCACSSASLPSIPLPFWVPWQGYTSWHCRALWNPLHGSISDVLHQSKIHPFCSSRTWQVSWPALSREGANYNVTGCKRDG